MWLWPSGSRSSTPAPVAGRPCLALILSGKFACLLGVLLIFAPRPLFGPHGCARDAGGAAGRSADGWPSHDCCLPPQLCACGRHRRGASDRPPRDVAVACGLRPRVNGNWHDHAGSRRLAAIAVWALASTGWVGAGSFLARLVRPLQCRGQPRALGIRRVVSGVRNAQLGGVACDADTGACAGRPNLVKLGAAHFHGGCAFCHGAPGIPVSPIARQMLPSPPDLATSMRPWTDEEIFWIVQHGIKYTGMPGWVALERADEIWAVVAFLRRMPQLTASSYAELALGGVRSGKPGRQGVGNRRVGSPEHRRVRALSWSRGGWTDKRAGTASTRTTRRVPGDRP